MLIKEKMFFTEHLSLMIKGGIPLIEALDVLKEESKSKNFRKALNETSKGVSGGETLTQGFKKYPKIFDNFFCSIIKLGEESGSLEENLKYLSYQLYQEFEMRKKVRGALIYPAIITIMALTIAFFVSFFILPKITGLFQLLDIELPLATRILISAALFLKEYWLFLLAGLVLIVLLLRIILAQKAVKFYFDKITLFLPFLSQIFQNINLTRFARNFSTLLKSDIPILEALEVCAETLPNEVYKKALISVKTQVEQGEKISQVFKKYPKIFPSVFSQMVTVGEKTGALEEIFLHLAEFYERETDSIFKNLSGIIEPILLILVGIFVAFVAMAVIMPIFKFTGQLRFR